jgi:hypothetical protein
VPALTAPTREPGISIRRDVLAHHTLTEVELGESLLRIANRVNMTSRQSIIDINRVLTFGVNCGENGLADRLNRFHNGLVLFLETNEVARL